VRQEKGIQRKKEVGKRKNQIISDRKGGCFGCRVTPWSQPSMSLSSLSQVRQQHGRQSKDTGKAKIWNSFGNFYISWRLIVIWDKKHANNSRHFRKEKINTILVLCVSITQICGFIIMCISLALLGIQKQFFHNKWEKMNWKKSLLTRISSCLVFQFKNRNESHDIMTTPDAIEWSCQSRIQKQSWIHTQRHSKTSL